MAFGGAKNLAQFEVCIVRLDGLGELDVGHRVFVCAKYFCLWWQAF